MRRALAALIVLAFGAAPGFGQVPSGGAANVAPGIPTPALRIVASGSSDTATLADGTIVWDKGSGSPSSENLPACTAALKGRIFTVKDGKGDAATNNITVSAPSSSIDGGEAYDIDQPHAAATFQCDGVSTWQVI